MQGRDKRKILRSSHGTKLVAPSKGKMMSQYATEFAIWQKIFWIPLLGALAHLGSVFDGFLFYDIVEMLVLPILHIF